MPTGITPATADRLLELIRKKPGQKLDREAIAKKLQIESDHLPDLVAQLRSWGYQLRITSKIILFLSAPDLLSQTEISSGLKSKRFGQNCYAYNSVKSTNDLARDLAESGAPEGTLVVADQQTRGRGRFKRVWYSPPGTGIYMSLVLRPKFNPEQAPAVSIVVALSLAETIAHYLDDKVMIKWPNDILLGHKRSGRVRKTAGILTELSAERGKIEHIIVGVGINVNQTAPDFPDDLRKQATSIRRVYRKKLSRVELLQRFLARLEKNYDIFCKSGLKPLQAKVRRLSFLIGREVQFMSGSDLIEGIAVDIDRHGCLIVKTAERAMAINAGEVSLLKR